jgi:phage-related protein
MTKGLSTDQKAAVAAEEVKTRTLLTITINNDDEDVLRILENDTLELFEYGDLTYVGSMVKRSKIESRMEGAVERCNIVISNVNQDISSIIVNEGDVLTGSTCVIEEIIYDTDTDEVLDDAIEIFSGKINNIHLSAQTFSFDVERNLGGYQYESPRTTYDVSCQWVFRDERCGYAGDLTTCDKTFTSCQIRGRQAYFGGFPSIPTEMVRKR